MSNNARNVRIQDSDPDTWETLTAALAGAKSQLAHDAHTPTQDPTGERRDGGGQAAREVSALGQVVGERSIPLPEALVRWRALERQMSRR